MPSEKANVTKKATSHDVALTKLTYKPTKINVATSFL